MKNFKKWEEWNNRPFEELVCYSKMEIEKSNDFLLLKKLKLNLFDFMNKYKDPEFENIIFKIKKN